MSAKLSRKIGESVPIVSARSWQRLARLVDDSSDGVEELHEGLLRKRDLRGAEVQPECIGALLRHGDAPRLAERIDGLRPPRRVHAH
eukprot:2454507-Prymnesium_polylepis.1